MSRSFGVFRPRGPCAGAIAFSLLPLAATWPSEGRLLASEAHRMVEVEAPLKSDAVAITKVTLGDAPVHCGLVVSRGAIDPVLPIQAGDDWLKDVTIYLLNRTDRTIVYGSLVIGFPETGDGIHSPQTVHIITLGQPPASAAFDQRRGVPIRQDPKQEPVWLRAHQTMTIHLADYIDQIRNTLQAATPLAAVTKCAIRKGSFYFANGMRWAIGNYSVPDPEHAGEYTRMAPSYFPGTPTWPPGYLSGDR